MTRMVPSRRGLVRGLSFAAVALLMLVVAPVKQASAMSLITPGASPSAKLSSEGLTTEVRGGGGGHGGGWHGGGFRVTHFHHRHFFVGGGYYYPYYDGGYYPYYYHPYCRVVWTHWGARRICGYHHRWHRRWHRRHHWHRRYW